MVGEALCWRGKREKHSVEITEGSDTQLRYGTHKKVEIFEWCVVKTVAKQVGLGIWGILSNEWWVMGDEWQKLSEKW